MSTSRFFLTALALLAGALPLTAMAEDFGTNSDETFDNSKIVSDAELATMRGGFVDINGMLIDFSFLSRVQVGMSMLEDVTVDTASLAIAAQAASNIQDLIQPQIIQNMDNNTLIAIQQTLNVAIIGSELLNQLAQMQQSSHQQTMGLF
jgi:hypothetical protein